MMKIKSFLPIGFIILVAVLVRVIWLDRVPPAITGDELSYILNIKSVILTGQGLKDNWSIFQALIFRYPVGLPQAELSYFLLYPAILLFNFSLFSTRLTFSFLSIATVFATYFLGKELFDKKTGLYIAAAAAINPWLIFMGRTTYEVVPATLFFILAIYFLLKEKSTRILLAFPFFLLAFYSYIGTKLIFIPIVFTVSFFSFLRNKKRFAKYYLILNCACVLLVALFAFSMLQAGNNRGNELFTPNDPEIIRQVDLLRKGSIAPSFISQIFVNKATIYGKIFAEKFLGVFSPSYLFIATDNFLSLYHGLFYYIDALFLVLGLTFMFAKKRNVFFLVFVLALIATLPQVFYKARTDIFSPHLVLFFTFLILIIGYGISQTVEALGNKIITVLIFLIYAFSFANFLNIYFFSFPLIGQFDFASREISNYISFASPKGPVMVYVTTPEDALYKYVYYTNTLNKQTVSTIKKAVSTKLYRIGNITFVPCGDIPATLNSSGSAVIYQSGICGPYNKDLNHSKIDDLRDGGEIYAIYNDNVCQKFSANPYPLGIKLYDFSIEKLSQEKFCTAFVSR